MSGRILVTCLSMPPFEEYCEEIASLWERHCFTGDLYRFFGHAC